VDAVATFGGEDGKMTGIERLLLRMERDEFDLIAVGRALIADPDWVSKIGKGESGKLKGFDAATLGELV
jgi:2,4-dienoyl-CoA reductase-like NADH-dependent reductase (Old Yellow Enzyme family)